MLASSSRLRKSAEINRVYKRGAYGGAEGLLSIKAAANGRTLSRAVVVVSKKVDKRAVVRNRIRRRLLGALLQLWATVPAGYDIVVSVHADISGLPAPRLHTLLGEALHRARVIGAFLGVLMFTTILVQPLFNLLAVIYALIPFHDFGVAIVLLTIVVRLILWPLVNKQLHSQKALQELQPEMQRIKSETKGDKQAEGKRVMELYKEKEINPFASFLPLLIQLPIFFALYVVLRDIIKPSEIAHLAYGPVQHLGPIADIIKSHGAFDPKFLGLIELGKSAPVLAALAALAQFVQTKQLQPKNQPKDSQAQMMAGMTYVFPVLTFIIGLTLPSALALYWLTTSLVAVLQQYLVLQRDVVELEASVDGSSVKPAAKKTPAKLVSGKPKAKGGKA